MTCFVYAILFYILKIGAYKAMSSLKPNIRTNYEGFTLLEIVIAVGLLFILSSVGAIAVRTFDDNAKQAAVNRAAREVYDVARAKLEDNNSKTDPADAATEYNSSQTPDENGNVSITVKVVKLDSQRISVLALYDGGRISATFSPTEGDTIGSGTPGAGGAPLPVIQDTVSKLTYQCDATTSGYLPIYNTSESSLVSLVGSDGSEKLVKYNAPAENLSSAYSATSSVIFYKYSSNGLFNNVSQKLTMNAGVSYTVSIYGEFDNLSNVLEDGNIASFNDCLISVDKLGRDSGLLTMNNFGGKKLTGMPDQIPPTVKNLIAVFKDATIINDPRIGNWDTSNVSLIMYAFHTASAFNVNIEKWNVSSVGNFTSVFQNAKSFNQPLNNWDMSKAITLYCMLYGALNFNQPLNDWDISKVNSLSYTFYNAQKFNQPLDKWNTSKVTNLGATFREARAFSGNISNWDTSSVNSMSQTFMNAVSFNVSIYAWKTHNVITMENMFNGATKFNSNISGWNVSKVTSYNNFDLNATALYTHFKPAFV